MTNIERKIQWAEGLLKRYKQQQAEEVLKRQQQYTIIENFIAAHCVVSSQEIVSKTKLYNEYLAFTSIPHNRKEFYHIFCRIVPGLELFNPRIDGQQVQAYKGVGLKTK
jgi:hypothetical protein